jgi:hypothetical protein
LVFGGEEMTQPKSKKEDIVIGTVFICLSILILISNVFLWKDYIWKPSTEPIVINYNEVFNNEYKGEINEFMLVAQRFAKEHTYNVTAYNCVNYTEDLKAITDELGFKTKKVIGCRNETVNNTQSCHEWLKIELDFEPQTAKFVDFSKEYPQQEVIE